MHFQVHFNLLLDPQLEISFSLASSHTHYLEAGIGVWFLLPSLLPLLDPKGHFPSTFQKVLGENRAGVPDKVLCLVFADLMRRHAW